MDRLLTVNAWEMHLSEVRELISYLQRVQSKRRPLGACQELRQRAQKDNLFYHCECFSWGCGKERWTCLLHVGEHVQSATGASKKEAKYKASLLTANILNDWCSSTCGCLPTTKTFLDTVLPTSREADVLDKDENYCPEPEWDSLNDKEKHRVLNAELDEYNGYCQQVEHENRTLLQVSNIDPTTSSEELRTACEEVGVLKAFLRNVNEEVANIQYRFRDDTVTALDYLNKRVVNGRRLVVSTEATEDEWTIA